MTWFGNKSANKINSDTDEKRNNNHENNLKDNKSRIREVVNSEIPNDKIK